MKFEKKASKKIFSGKIFNIHRDLILYPDGRQAEFDLIYHGGAVAILPIDHQGNIWLVRQYRASVGDLILEIPAGTLEKGEDPDDCAAREIREEIGMAAKDLIRIGEFYVAPGYSTEYMYMYLARDLHPDQLTQDEDEYIEVVKFPYQELYQMAEQGEIKDTKTVAALMMARSQLFTNI